MIASREIFVPISYTLLVMHYQMFQECCPMVQSPDNPRELEATGTPLEPSSAPMGSQGETQHHGMAKIRS